MVKVTALVVNWGTPQDLIRCVMSAEQFEDHLNWGIYNNAHPVVDSTVALNRLQQGFGERMVINWGRKNLGHGRGINSIARMVPDSDYLFIVNPDCVWTEPILERMIGFLEADPRRAVVGPKQMDSDHKITAGGIFGSNRHPKHRDWRKYDPRNVHARDAVESVTVAGSAMLISRHDFFWASCWTSGMLESKHYYSETWLCYHLRAHGREVWYWGEPWMIHEWHRSSPIGFPGSDGKFKDDRELFRKYCDEHDPPIERD